MIPSRWPDPELWAVTYLRPLVTGVTFETEENPSATVPASPYKRVLVTAIVGQRVTPITQQVRLDFEVRCTRVNGTPWLWESNRIAGEIAYHLENATRDGNPVVFAEKDTGPTKVSDPVEGPLFHELSVVLEVKRS